MQRMGFKRLLALFAVVVMLCGAALSAAAEESGFFVPYSNYEYNYYKELCAGKFLPGCGNGAG